MKDNRCDACGAVIRDGATIDIQHTLGMRCGFDLCETCFVEQIGYNVRLGFWSRVKRFRGYRPAPGKDPAYDWLMAGGLSKDESDEGDESEE